MTAPELTPRERAIVTRMGIHDTDLSPAATARERGWKSGTRLHGGPIRVPAHDAELTERARAEQRETVPAYVKIRS